MELNDVKFGVGHIYYCNKHAARCVVVGSHCDDGAALFIELVKGDDLTSKYRLTEACHLTDNTKRGDYECYQCGERTNWLAPDSRCGKCTRYTPAEIRGDE